MRDSDVVARLGGDEFAILLPHANREEAEVVARRVDRLIIEAVVTLAAGAGREAVAEHVVDQPTADLLQDLGVGLGQGFHLGVPRPWDELVDVLGVSA